MQEKKNIRLLITLGVLLLLCTGMIVAIRLDDKPAVDPYLFKLADASNVDHVLLEAKSQSIDLKFDGTRWKVNGKYDADPQLIKVLMATLLQITPKRPVPTHQRDSVELRLKHGTTVSVVAAGDTIKKFVAGGNITKTEAYFKDSETGAEWLVHIPGYRVYASGIFELDVNGWRDKRIFNFNWRNFRGLNVHYPKDGSSDFEIKRQEDFLGVVGLSSNDSTRLNSFLNDVLVLTADRILPAGTSVFFDSLTNTTPLMLLNVEGIADRAYHLELYPAAPGAAMMAGKAWDGEIVLFDRKKLFPIVKKRNYFGK